ncbi:Uncharacterised protein [Mycobacteroides abscessus subsp. massiliense]|nr:Uncharacterised protein [Mycobacteroides abscessus subsp. massiliense]
MALKSFMIVVNPARQVDFDYWDKAGERPVTFRWYRKTKFRIFASVKNASNALRGDTNARIFDLFWDEEKQQLLHIEDGEAILISEVKR